MVEMELIGVRVELPTNTPIVLLRETEGEHRTLPIFIGGPEATAIAFALEQVETPRPMTHDLMKTCSTTSASASTGVVVTELRESTFYAELHLATNGQTHGVEPPLRRHRPGRAHGHPDLRRRGVLDEAGYAARGRGRRSRTRSSSSSGSSSTA